MISGAFLCEVVLLSMFLVCFIMGLAFVNVFSECLLEPYMNAFVSPFLNDYVNALPKPFAKAFMNALLRFLSVLVLMIWAQMGPVVLAPQGTSCSAARLTLATQLFAAVEEAFGGVLPAPAARGRLRWRYLRPMSGAKR